MGSYRGRVGRKDSKAKFDHWRSSDGKPAPVTVIKADGTRIENVKIYSKPTYVIKNKFPTKCCVCSAFLQKGTRVVFEPERQGGKIRCVPSSCKLPKEER